MILFCFLINCVIPIRLRTTQKIKNIFKRLPNCLVCAINSLFFKMSALQTFLDCAEIQKKLFFSSFLEHNRIGEIICVNGIDNEDSYLFERFDVHGKGFVVSFRLMSEDTLISEQIHYSTQPVATFVKSKNEELWGRYNDFLKKLAQEGKTVESYKQELLQQGADTRSADFKEFTRETLEDTLAPGRKRINGDRNTRIQIMQRQVEIPNDLQKPAVNVYELPMPAQVCDYLLCLTAEEREDWEKENLVDTVKGSYHLGCSLPFLKDRVEVAPDIYHFPERELDVERELGNK